jgi:hypothetical protein
MLRQAHPRRQGDLGEAAAIAYLANAGANVLVPLFHSPDYDLVADYLGRLLRVQVKTCTHVRDRRFKVALSTRGGNQSWNGTVKRFDAKRCDYLFVLVADGRRWFIPSDRVGGAVTLRLGGPRYARYEVDTRMSTLDVQSRGSVGAGEPSVAVNHVPLC